MLAGPRDWKLEPVRIRTIESLGNLSAFDDYMAEAAGDCRADRPELDAK